MKNTRVHFIGIGGVGMSALALALIDEGAIVKGSDISTSYLTDLVEQRGAKVFVGQKKEQIQDVDLVIYSTDIQPDNAELVEAKKQGVLLLHRSELLDILQKGKKSLQVTGTHGKTTITSLLAHVLETRGDDPSFAIGGIPFSLKKHGKIGKGEFFVAESDESDGSFLRTLPYGAIVSNLECEHMDYFKTKHNLQKAFKLFGSRVENKNLFFWCQDDQELAQLNLEGISYGFSEKAHGKICNFIQEAKGIVFDLSYEDQFFSKIYVPLIGRHNAQNAAAVFLLAYKLKKDPESIKHALQTFSGVKRRLEFKGERQGIAIWDDYAHHPTEIKATLSGFRSALPREKRLISIWQPHRYSRVRDCFDLFQGAFNKADLCIMTDIYAAREKPLEGFTTDTLFSHLLKKRPDTLYFPQDKLLEGLMMHLRENDVVVTLGAGDITVFSQSLLQKLSSKERE